METRANHVWVGAVTLLILGALALFIVWLARLGGGAQNEYDIFFKQSVAGLANGSSVDFAGVPVGQVNEIVLWDKDPEFVRVRIKVKESVPILVGTTATIQGSFTGVSTITLDGARSGAPPISCETTACTEGVPIIPPTTGGGFGAVLASAPLLLERLATLTERLTVLLSDRNQEEISQILANTNAASAGFAAAAPQLERTMAELQVTLREASEALDQFEKVTASTDRILNQEGEAIARDLRSTLESASGAAKALEDTLNEARPATRQLTESTLPAAEATLRDLRATSKALRDVTETIDEKGAGALLSSQPLPDYKP
ncbi:MAG: MlaD family protein [Erythrobacter sp.]|jgi:phospholipid/cholesterol/gamma-HCH transport system substrate-binding protein|uniref:MlaD family protein n=1 Tax=Qipengyuania TaxID=1855416 RepID=UPI0020A0AE77|nr:MULTISPECIES: MlaD family protein [Qipengyuania]MCP2017240.1 phospholipid/cholesterol/gamma-HCH transport system substrate-binding protein [Qipengyuania citrea]MDE0901339.1 MlaD family protein [Erythrobacter sp.]WPL56612.1 MlaD family protein [Qipengyuania sp. HL-TH5]|tara:strand:+ start:108695 stop:109645 length:951 start_codon:yes stop_codon:yes gene_type:complete